jgi:DNA-binding LytR/AlgR family response regulator
MKVIIVEDERLAAERLKTLLEQYDSSLQVQACLESVEETVAYLKIHAHPDLLLLDIHLSDGRSFDIFRQVHYTKPIVFTTAYDQYALDAFKMVSVDYILKPVTSEALAAALNKYKNLAASFNLPDYSKLTQPHPVTGGKKRFLGKAGQRLFFIEAEDVYFFQAENKIVYLIDKNSNRYIVDHTLEKLEELLNPREFFRLNRRYIVRFNAIEQVRPYFNSRLKVYVKGAQQQDDMIISRDRIAEFKLWADF